MYLRTKVGPYAGQVHDYSIQAALGALSTGAAERLEETTVPPQASATIPAREVEMGGTTQTPRARRRQRGHNQ